MVSEQRMVFLSSVGFSARSNAAEVDVEELMISTKQIVQCVLKAFSCQHKKKETISFNHADHSFDELKLIINFRLLWLHSGHVVVCTAILPLA